MAVFLTMCGERMGRAFSPHPPFDRGPGALPQADIGSRLWRSDLALPQNLTFPLERTQAGMVRAVGSVVGISDGEIARHALEYHYEFKIVSVTVAHE